MDRQTIGNYRIIRELGRGGMGIVYHGFDPAIGRAVAIKTIRLEPALSAEESAELRQRFVREASAAGKLSHPGIVTIYQLGEDGKDLFIAMEYVSGENLQDILVKNPRMEPGRAMGLLRQIAEALDYAHHFGIVHRDIKPQNILIREDGCAKIADFGIAKVVESMTQAITKSGASLGSPSYMSPEQIRGDKVDSRSDQFSLAIVAFQMLAGRLPFDAESTHAIMYQIASLDPFTMWPEANALPPGTRQALARALSKQPQDRFPSCSSFVQELSTARAAAGAAAGYSSSTTVPTARPSETTTMPVAAPVPRKKKTSPLLPIIVIVLVVLLGAGFVLLRKKSSSLIPGGSTTSTGTPAAKPPSLLVKAIAEGRMDDAQKLIASGTDVNESNEDGTTALMQAAEGSGYLPNNAPAVTMLLDRGARVDAQDKNGRTALYRAVSEGKEEAAHILVAHKADPNHKTNDGSAPLLAAVTYGHPNLVSFLLASGAAIDQADVRGDTPLMVASEGTAYMPNNVPLVKILMEKQPRLEAQDAQGRTAFYRAVAEGKIDAARLLLDAKADLNTRAANGSTPLLAAVTYGKLPMVELLLERHADVELADAQGNTPLLVAGEGNAYLPNNAPLVSVLIAAHAKVNVQDAQGRTPLFRASAEGKEDAMRILLDNKADPNLKSSNGWTPLLAAVTYAKLGAATLLLARGADPNLADASGVTPLMAAAESNPYMKSPAEFIALLLSHGAKPEITDAQGRTALARATQDKNTAAIDALQKK